MRKLTILLGIMFLSNFVVAQNVDMTKLDKEGTLEVTVDGWANDSLVVITYVWDAEGENIQYVMANNGKFSITTKPNEVMSVVVFSKNSGIPRKSRPYPLRTLAKSIKTEVIPGVSEKIEGKLTDKILEYTVLEGAQYHKDYAKQTMQNRDLDILLDANEEQIALVNVVDAKMFDRRREIENLKRERYKQYILENPSTDLACEMVSNLSYSDAIEFEKKLTLEARSGLFKMWLDYHLETAKEYAEVIEASKTMIPGNQVPEFALKSADGSTITLDELLKTKKWLVVDFWGTWCGPCMIGMLKMKEAYEKYKDKVEFVGIACKDKEDEWLKTIKEKQLPWTQLINLDESKSSVTVRYAVEAYPTKVIIDPQGKIVEIFKGEGEDFYKKLESLF